MLSNPDMCDHSPIRLADCWAKTDPITGKPELAVRDHCMLVGQIAECMLYSISPLVRDQMPKGSITLIAAHDLGKITPGFQLKCAQWEHHKSISQSIHHDGLESKHAHVSAWHLAYSQDAIPNDARYWLVSTGGHHGSYPAGFKKPSIKCNEGVDADPQIHPHFAQLRAELLVLLTATFGPLPTEPSRGQEIRTHLLTGFTIFADWIGSNSEWFPPDFPIDESAIAEKSRAILKNFGLPIEIRPHLSFGQLFAPAAQDKSFTPRPLQQTLIDATDRPGLYIVEAPMGTGKTEAALAAAYRRWTEGDERGLYFALPTQLTSAKIHDRIQSFLAAILDAPSFQSLIHGNAWLSDNRNRLIATRDAEGEHLDTDEALRWFSTTRRQLLARFGTGTIDQALLAILPARFAALRHFALAGKVVVIDEVHSYDPYMSALIDRLIAYLLPVGSTVIILSATLTAARRAELVAAAGATEPEAPTEAYPLITKVATGDTTASHHPVTDPTPEKPVELHHEALTLEDTEAYWQTIADAVLAGANVVIIRNTVALSQETYKLLKSKLNDSIPDDHTGLLHSRFTHAARLANESRWIEILGKNPDQRPTGSLLVATQIVEQSVDIDADLLVTDLAPVELILQRIGRLHRHPHQRPAGFDTACCHILHSPVDWQADADTIESALAPHHYIYPPLALWQAQQTLAPREIITLPIDIRPLLESAAATQPDPAILQAFEKFLPDSQKQVLEQQGTAKTRHVFAKPIDDKEGRETRYRIQPTAHLVLLKSPPEIRANSITIDPVHGSPVTCPAHHFSYPLARALNENAIRIPAYLVRDAIKSTPEWLRNHLSDAILAVVQSDSTKLELPLESQINYSFEHTNELGLTWKKSDNPSKSCITTDPEDYWL